MGRIVYGRNELLLIGKEILLLENVYKILPKAWSNLNNLSICSKKKTHRGSKRGRRKYYTKTGPAVASTPATREKTVGNFYIYSRPKPKPAQIKCVLVNARSICNKGTELNDFITSNDTDLLYMTKTWLNGNIKDNVILAELLPPNYGVLHTPRTTGRGGGVGLVYRKDLPVRISPQTKYVSFEHICFKIVSASVMYHAILLYRPPTSRKNPVTTSLFF